MSRENAVRSGSYAVTTLSRKRRRVGGAGTVSDHRGDGRDKPGHDQWARHELCACYIADLLL